MTMDEDEFLDRLSELEYALIDAQNVRHERAIYNKMIALFEECNQPDMIADLKESIRYQKFLAREEWQNTYDWTVVRLPKPIRSLVVTFQRLKKRLKLT